MNSAGLGAFRYLGLGSYWGDTRIPTNAALSLRRAAEPPARGSQSLTARAQPPDSRRPFLLPAATAPITVDPSRRVGVCGLPRCAGCLALRRIWTARPTLRANALCPPIEHGRKSVPWSTSHPCPNTPKPVSPMTLQALLARSRAGGSRAASLPVGDGGSGIAPPALLAGVAAARITHCELVALPRRRDAVPQPGGTEKGSRMGRARGRRLAVRFAHRFRGRRRPSRRNSFPIALQQPCTA